MPVIVLHQFPSLAGLPSMSPFCLKVHIALSAKQMAYTVQNTFFPKRTNRFGKLPVLEWDSELFYDSSHILPELESRSSEPPLYPIEPRARARAKLLEDWADESLFWHAAFFKFIDPEGWNRFGTALRQVLPAWLGPVAPAIARRRMRAELKAQGLTRRSDSLRQAEFESHLDSLECLIEDTGFLVDDKFSVADIAVASMLLPISTDLTPRSRDTIAERDALTRYLDGIRRTYLAH